MLPTFIVMVAYLLGSIPFGLILTRYAGVGDIRRIGSGNIGATNVLRTGNKKLALLTLLADMLKGAVAVVVAIQFAPEIQGVAALAALLGHMFPVWLAFKGGKGVATALGILLAFSPPAAIMAGLVWLVSAYILRISSASALVAIGTAPVFIIIFHGDSYLSAAFIMAVLVFIKHSDNIVRMLNGTEPLIGEIKKDAQK